MEGGGAAPKEDAAFPNAGAGDAAFAPKLNDGVAVGVIGGAKLKPPGVEVPPPGS